MRRRRRDGEKEREKEMDKKTFEERVSPELSASDFPLFFNCEL